MRLVFAIKALSQLGGGAERVFVQVANGLRARGHDVHVLTFESAARASFYPLDRDISRIDAGGKTGKAGQLLGLPSARSRIAALRPDLVIGFMPSCYVPLGAILVGTGIPFIASEHNVPERYADQPLRWLTIQASSWYTDTFTAVSEQMLRQYPETVRRKMIVVPNPVDVPEGGLANVLGTAPDRGQVLAVGRLHPQKDHVTLVEAFARVAGEFPGWTLRILGDGTERQRIADRITRAGLTDRIAMPGTVRDIGAEYGASQLYVIPSRYESLGLATVEALAHGLPAIGFADCPGTNELVLDGVNGVLVAPGEDRVASLAEAMRGLMREPAARKRLADGARATIQSNTLPAVLDQWEALLARTLASRTK